MSSSTNPEHNTKRIVYLACDGFGQELQDSVEKHLQSNSSIEVKNLGCDTYYDAAQTLSKQIQLDDNPTSAGILFCGTGMGVGIVANKHKGIRAATCENTMSAKCARAVNNANVLCLGKLVTPPNLANDIVDAFTNQGFIEQPKDDDGNKVDWWNNDVESFLKQSMQGVTNVEDKATTEATS